jgi:hypothetical protein
VFWSQDHPEVRSPSAKRAKLVENSQASIPSQNSTKTVLEDISNFRNEVRSRENSDISASQVHIPLLGERKFYRRIPGLYFPFCDKSLFSSLLRNPMLNCLFISICQRTLITYRSLIWREIVITCAWKTNQGIWNVFCSFVLTCDVVVVLVQKYSILNWITSNLHVIALERYLLCALLTALNWT